MKIKASLLRALFVSTVAAACESSPTAPQPSEPFELKVGDTVRVAGSSSELTITFLEVRGDSRCPVDVTCVRAGEANVVFVVSAGDEEPVELVFEVPPGGSAEQAHQGFRIDILRLEPQAHSERRIDPESYIATVSVDEG